DIAATGRQLATSTWSGSSRLEHATFSYDHLGHLTSMTRFLDAAAAASPVTTSWHTDSIGELVELDEPNSAAQFRSYDSWGELIDMTRNAANGTDTLHAVTQYDALGRVIRREERTNAVTDPDTVAQFAYDSAVLGRGRLSQASTPTSSVSFRYDA